MSGGAGLCLGALPHTPGAGAGCAMLPGGRADVFGVWGGGLAAFVLLSCFPACPFCWRLLVPQILLPARFPFGMAVLVNNSG